MDDESKKRITLMISALTFVGGIYYYLFSSNSLPLSSSSSSSSSSSELLNPNQQNKDIIQWIVKHIPHPALKANNKDISKLGKLPEKSWNEIFADIENIKKSHLDDENIKTKILFLCRHAEGSHNAAERRLGKELWEDVEAKDMKYFDAQINNAGVKQSEELKRAVSHAIDHDGLKIETILVSPLTRAIETGRIGFAKIWGKVPTKSYEVSRERFGKNTCDMRKDLSKLRAEFPEIDFILDAEKDPHWTHERETPEQVKERAAKLLDLIMEDDSYESVLLCGHSDYISNMLELVGHHAHWPANCEVVSVIIQGKKQIKKQGEEL